MSYSCSDFTNTILDALNIEVPWKSYDSPSDQADLALEAIKQMKEQAQAARAMLAALKHVETWIPKTVPPTTFAPRDMVRAAIAAAEAANIK